MESAPPIVEAAVDTPRPDPLPVALESPVAKGIGGGLAVVFAIGVLLALVHQCREHYPLLNNEGDWAVYYRAGAAMAHRLPIYTLEHGELLTFKNAPVVALLIAPLTLLPPFAARAVWFMGDLGLFACIFVLCQWILPAGDGRRGRQMRAWVGLGTWFLVDRFLMFQLGAGTNAALYIALCIAACWWAARGRAAAAGAALAGAVFLKVVPICLLPYLLLHRRPAIGLASFATTAVALALLPAAWIGWDANRQLLAEWPRHLRDTDSPAQNARPTNQSILALISRTIGPEQFGRDGKDPAALRPTERYRPHIYLSAATVQRVWLALGVAVAAALCALLWRTRPSAATIPARNAATNAMHISLLLIYMTLFNPLAWRYNFIALLVPYYFVLNTIWHHPGRRKPLAWMVATAYVLIWVPMSVRGMPWLDAFQIYGARAWGTLVLAAAVGVAWRTATRDAAPDVGNSAVVRP